MNLFKRSVANYKISLTLLSFLVLLQYGAGLGALFSKGLAFNALNQISSKPSILFILISMIGFQLLSVASNVAFQNLKDFLSIPAAQKFWENHFPRKIIYDQRDRFASTYQAFVEHYSTWYNYLLEYRIQIFSAVVLVGIYGVLVFRDSFWVGLAYLPFLFLSSWLGSRFFNQKLESNILSFQTSRSNLLNWTQIFFKSNSELASNWGKRSSYEKWINSKINDYSEKHTSVVATQFKKNLVSSLFVEAPFWLCVAYTFYSASNGKLSFVMAFVWFGITEYLVQASRFLNGLSSIRVQFKASQKLWESELAIFHHQENPQFLNISDEIHPFKLRTSEQVKLSTKSGLYNIQASNASGKSTLLRMISGFQKPQYFEQINQIANFSRELSSQTLVVEKDAAIFPEFKTFFHQVLGPDSEFLTTKEIQDKVKTKLYENLPIELATSIEEIFHEIDILAQGRNTIDFSSGEKVWLSLARAIVHKTNSSKALIVDESESPLSEARRNLFIRVLRNLSKQLAVYWITHHEYFLFHTEGYALACNEAGDEGHVIPFRMRCKLNQTGEILGLGNIGESLVTTLKLVRQTFTDRPGWEWLKTADLMIDSSWPAMKVGETDSAGLSLAIALVNFNRMIRGEEAILGVAATGQITISGKVEAVRGTSAKLLAARGWKDRVKSIISWRDVERIDDLEILLLQNSRSHFGAAASPKPLTLQGSLEA